MGFYEKDPGFLEELLKHFFTPQFRTAYYRTTKKQPPGSLQSVQATPLSDSENAANAELGFPTEPTAVLSVTSGFKEPNQRMNGMPMWLLNNSYTSLLRNTKLLNGLPGSTARVTPLRVWITACFKNSPVCLGMVQEFRPT